MTQCCGPDHCAPTIDEYVCQALKLLPDFSGKLKPNGNYVKIATALIEAFYDCVVMSSCDVSEDFSPCTSEVYFESWISEFGLPFRCPIEISNPSLELTLLRLQLCLQAQFQAGAVFNQGLLDQIAEALEISYSVRVPTYKIEGVPICDLVLAPSGSVQRCSPNGCAFQQSFIVDVTCAPSAEYIQIFECYIEQFVPCHVTYCVVDKTPQIIESGDECTEFVIADCADISINILSQECTETVEAD